MCSLSPEKSAHSAPRVSADRAHCVSEPVGMSEPRVNNSSSSGSGSRPGPFDDWRTRWGERKRPRTVSLTDTCWEILTAIANEQGNHRSDVIEALVRRSGKGVSRRQPEDEK